MFEWFKINESDYWFCEFELVANKKWFIILLIRKKKNLNHENRSISSKFKMIFYIKLSSFNELLLQVSFDRWLLKIVLRKMCIVLQNLISTIRISKHLGFEVENDLSLVIETSGKLWICWIDLDGLFE